MLPHPSPSADPRITEHEAIAILEANATALFGMTASVSGATS
jgi:hypothetical protein